MKETIAADPQELRSVRPSVHRLADAIHRISIGLTQALEAEGPCWGSDEWGVAFAATYLPASAVVRSLVAGTATAIDDLAATLAVVADVFATAEHEAGRRVA